MKLCPATALSVQSEAAVGPPVAAGCRAVSWVSGAVAGGLVCRETKVAGLAGQVPVPLVPPPVTAGAFAGGGGGGAVGSPPPRGGPAFRGRRCRAARRSGQGSDPSPSRCPGPSACPPRIAGAGRARPRGR